MKLKMKVGMSGPDISLSPGDPHECEDAEALRLIEAGIAEEAQDETPAQRVTRLKKELAEAQATAKSGGKGPAKA